MSGLIVSLILAATLITAFMSSIFGMLGGLVLMGVLVSLLPVSAAMVLHGLIQLTSNGYRAWLNRADIDWRIFGLFTIGTIVTLAVLTVLAFQPNTVTVFLALGLMPYIAAALPKSLALDITKGAMPVFAGFVVVGTNLLAGVGGPLLDVFFQRTALTRHQVVATKAVAQSLGHLSKIIFFGGLAAQASSADRPPLWLLLPAIAAAMLGTRLGKRVLDNMHDATFFAWTQRLMLGVGAVLIVRGVYLLATGG